jgi:L-threonylcarbamoyladenylate synthase
MSKLTSPSQVLSKRTLWQSQFAAHILRMGGVIAHPTEAVWGLACDPHNEAAVKALLRLKNRPVEKGLILVSGWHQHFDPLLSLLPESRRDMFFSPIDRPTTWLVPDPEHMIPGYVKGQFSTVALRLSQHPVIVALTRHLNTPIISTSANPAGNEPAMSLLKVNQYFSNEVDYILPAALGQHARPSEIRDLMTGNVLRC